ncbi:ATP-dependent helicase (plasmid) [Dinoroseobacter shibae]|jgi:DNA helicase-2/ATP-dependent DNA helicase PcrA|uniref:UvrD-helicase domain-containing protein n=1 Tax=Dinoroseobacter shibae TaxID=215813 RepID=UPI0020223671|nr:UvrD-helicase domain-containing protein [Dinoroseobacter shibae]URF49285.1 ATP-dependent helicase [Dinoroseobacter shibae]URF53592.1 ATP-dependent helicase [Dinoroseobacter shibae]
MADIDLLTIDCGSVSAPAGCGKTHLIASALQRHDESKPILIMTHTNAGVAALRARLTHMGVPQRAYRITTIDGWAMRLIGTFPHRSGHAEGVLDLADPRNDYPAIRQGTINILAGDHLRDVLQATYARLFVDEYQDCLVEQHAMVSKIAEVLPTCVLGDPMQAIFGWGTNVLVDWEADVHVRFPPAGELDTPWRWRNVGTEAFGRWLLQVRSALQSGQPIDLTHAPAEVEVITITGDDDVPNQTKAANTRPPVEGGSALIVCDAKRPPRHREIAARARGAVVVENADLTDFIRFAASFDMRAPTATDELIDFAGSTMTGVGAAQMKQRLRVLLAGRERSPPNDAEAAALAFARAPSPTAAVALLVEINRQAGVFPLRPALVRSAIQAFNGCVDVEDFHEMAVRAREQSRVKGRALPRRAVGSTLLLKGLEADVAVIIDTDLLNARDLYVAMTRGSRKLVICTSSPVLVREIQ